MMTRIDGFVMYDPVHRSADAITIFFNFVAMKNGYFDMNEVQHVDPHTADMVEILLLSFFRKYRGLRKVIIGLDV